MPIQDKAFVPEAIIQIGAGGVGSRLADELRYFMRGNYQELASTWLTVVDHDTLSPRNLNRQLYFPHEVSNKSKGQILVERYLDSIKINQIPEAVNLETLPFIFSEEVLNKKILVICAADNGLVVKQVIEYLLANAKNDWLWIFTGAQLIDTEINGYSVQTGSGQAYAYGVINETPLFPIPPTETLTDIMSLTGFGPSSTGQGCGVDAQSGAQTPLMNDSCVNATMTIINMFFTQGLFIPCIYFTDGKEWIFGDAISLESLLSSSIPEDLFEELEVEHEEELQEVN